MDQPRKIRLAYFVSHPIQYQAPLLRRIAADPGIDLTVYFTSDFSVRGYLDKGFGVNVTWDTPLLDGYRSEFLPKGLFPNARHERHISFGVLPRLWRGRFDAIWVHGYTLANQLQAIVAGKLLGIPVLLRAESNLYDRQRSRWKLRLKDAFFAVLRRFLTGVLAIGTANRRYWEHYFGKHFPIFDMPYAVDNGFFQRESRQAAARREELRAQLGLEAGRPIVLFASKLQQRKRCIDLVEAFLRLPGPPGNRRQPYLLIIGDGEERANLERRAGGHSAIKFLGFQNQTELPRFFDLCDLFVLPSIHEPWGLVVNEAMNAGRAVIVSGQVGCQPDLVEDGVNGFVFEGLNVESLTAALAQALESPERLRQMGRESLRIIDNYGFDQNLAGLRAALRAVVPPGKLRSAETTATGAEGAA
jgi:glycosyltransferase involved in cell wall biosynthesis